MVITGIDVSRHQGAVDFGAVKRAGHDFAIIKATEGTSYSYVDWYRTHAPKVEAAGLVLGAYHFLRADRDPVQQARYFVSTVGSFRNRIAVVDVETAANDTKPRIHHVEAFATEFRRLVPGHVLVVYTGRWYWRDTIGNPKGAHIGPLWHSEYEVSQAEVADGPEADRYGGWDGCTLWQWTSSGRCPGVSGNCDLNILRRGTLAALTGATPTQEDEDMYGWTVDDYKTVHRNIIKQELPALLKPLLAVGNRTEMRVAGLGMLIDELEAGNAEVDEAELAEALAELIPVKLADQVVDAIHRRTAPPAA